MSVILNLILQATYSRAMQMFEKFSNLNIDSSGYGGEYTVQAGFGWTNGVLLWVASTYGEQLVAPQCPPLVAAAATNTTSTSAAVGLQAPSGAVITVVVIAFMAPAYLL
jgi:alpha,alpha-trehalase